MTIVEFLLARVTEDEAAARASTEGPWQVDTGAHRYASLTRGEDIWIGDIDHDLDAAHIVRHDPARVLAECAAKRAIIERHVARVEQLDESGRPAHLFDPVLSMLVKDDRYVLSHFAAVYTEHEDYREEWKP